MVTKFFFKLKIIITMSSIKNENSNFPSENTININTEKNGIVKIIGAGARLASLDFYRGLVMVLLMFESSGLYDHFMEHTKGSFLHSLQYSLHIIPGMDYIFGI